jgi:AraC-like DNA-binding protein
VQLSAIERPLNSAAVAALIARSRANVARSRWLCDRARIIVATSVRLCPAPLIGASDADGPDGLLGQPVSSEPASSPVSDSPARRSVVVLASDSVMRAVIADALRGQHDIAEAADVSKVLEIVASGVRIDAVVAGCFMFDEGWALDACARLARELYEYCPWIPVVMVADTPPATLKADLLLTAVRTFVSRDFAPHELAATVARVARRPHETVPTDARVAAITRTFAVLERAITNVPALAALAAMADMSRSHFSRTFHAVAGIPLRDYVRDLRLRRAHELMCASRLSLTAIATASGFYDLPHFNKAFRHRFGMSPTEFRLASSVPHSSPAT